MQKGPGTPHRPCTAAAAPPSSLVVGGGDVDEVQLAPCLQLPFTMAHEVLLLLPEPALEEVGVKGLEPHLVATELLNAVALRSHGFASS